jgi:hypothetical protein
MNSSTKSSQVGWLPIFSVNDGQTIKLFTRLDALVCKKIPATTNQALFATLPNLIIKITGLFD